MPICHYKCLQAVNNQRCRPSDPGKASPKEQEDSGTSPRKKDQMKETHSFQHINFLVLVRSWPFAFVRAFFPGGSLDRRGRCAGTSFSWGNPNDPRARFAGTSFAFAWTRRLVCIAHAVNDML